METDQNGYLLPQRGIGSSTFASFCNIRMQPYMEASKLPFETKLLLLGVNDEGKDGYFFASNGFQVTAIDKDNKPEDWSPQSRGRVRFKKQTLKQFFNSSYGKQHSIHGMYCNIFHVVPPDKRSEVMSHAFYLLRHGGYFMIEGLGTLKEESKYLEDAINGMLLVKDALNWGFKLSFYDQGRFSPAEEDDPFTCRAILIR